MADMIKKASYCGYTWPMFGADNQRVGVYRCSGEHTTDKYGLWHLSPEGVPCLEEAGG